MDDAKALAIAIPLIRGFEGCRLKAYADQGGKITIGWGSTGPGIELGVSWTQHEADDRNAADVAAFMHRVKEIVRVQINENQLAALTSFAYNVGYYNLRKSGLLRFLNQERVQAAADQFLVWNRVGSYVSNGLTKRRQKERELFLATVK